MQSSSERWTLFNPLGPQDKKSTPPDQTLKKQTFFDAFSIQKMCLKNSRRANNSISALFGIWQAEKSKYKRGGGFP